MARPDRDRGYRPQMNIAAPPVAPVEPVSVVAAAEPAPTVPDAVKAPVEPVAPAPKAAQPEPAPPESQAPAPAALVGPKGHVLARWTEAGMYDGPFFTHPERDRRPHAKGPTVGWFPVASVDKLVTSFERV